MTTPADPARANVMLVLEVPDADVARKALEARRVRFLAETYRPPWGGSRFFCVDPDGYLVEIEQPAS
jgi:catechol 2,3-dioxygenase-like lactoylglutathione lyase family enzyme